MISFVYFEPDAYIAIISSSSIVLRISIQNAFGRYFNARRQLDASLLSNDNPRPGLHPTVPLYLLSPHDILNQSGGYNPFVACSPVVTPAPSYCWRELDSNMVHPVWLHPHLLRG